MLVTISTRYNDDGIHTWNVHSPNWIYQGGPNQSWQDIHDTTYNQWEGLDDSSVAWHVSQVSSDVLGTARK